MGNLNLLNKWNPKIVYLVLPKNIVLEMIAISGLDRLMRLMALIRLIGLMTD